MSRRANRPTNRWEQPSTGWGFLAWLLCQGIREYLKFLLLVVLFVAAIRIGGSGFFAFLVRLFR